MWNITNPWTYQPRWRQLNFQNVTGLIERYVVYKKHDNKWRAYCFYIVVILQHNMGTWSWSHRAMHNGVLLFLDKNYYQKVIATYYQLHATLHDRFAACQTRTLLWRTDLLFLLSGPYCRLGGKVQFWNAWQACHSGGHHLCSPKFTATRVGSDWDICAANFHKREYNYYQLTIYW